MLMLLLAVKVKFPELVMLLPAMLMLPISSIILSAGIMFPAATRSRVLVLSVPPIFMFD